MNFVVTVLVLAVIGALVLVLLFTDIGDSCCSGALLLLYLIGMGALALVLLGIFALFALSCAAIF